MIWTEKLLFFIPACFKINNSGYKDGTVFVME